MPLRLPRTRLPTPSRLPLARFRLSYRPLTTTPRLYLKEDADRSPEQIEQKKQEQLKKQEKGEGEWHESLGSQSESHVKADRQEVEDHDEHIEDLQKEGKEQSEKEKI